MPMHNEIHYITNNYWSGPMPTFIQVTKEDGSSAYVQIDKILAVTTDGGKTNICLGSVAYIQCKESAKEVLHLIAAASKGVRS